MWRSGGQAGCGGGRADRADRHGQPRQQTGGRIGRRADLHRAASDARATDAGCGASCAGRPAWSGTRQCPSSAREPPQGTPGGSGRLGAPKGEAGPLGAPPRPRLLEPSASKAADCTALGPPGRARLSERGHEQGRPAARCPDAGGRDGHRDGSARWGAVRGCAKDAQAAATIVWVGCRFAPPAHSLPIRYPPYYPHMPGGQAMSWRGLPCTG